MTQINKEEPIKTIGTECNNNNANVISDTKIKDTLSRNMFKFNYVIGKGGFGKVWQVLYKKTKQPFALKEMSKTKILDKKSEKSINFSKFIIKIFQEFISICRGKGYVLYSISSEKFFVSFY